jgi:hypothetical protein
MTNINRKIHPAVHSDSKVWLAGPHGTGPNEMPSVTVRTSLFAAGAKTNGFIPSGVRISETGAGTGIYGPYNAAGLGRHGILFQAIDTSNGEQDFGTAMLVHGFVFGAKLPGGTLTADERADLPLIYVY